MYRLTTANTGDAKNDDERTPDEGEGCNGDVIFPEHVLDAPSVTDVVTYDVNANVAKKIIANSAVREIAEQVA